MHEIMKNKKSISILAILLCLLMLLCGCKGKSEESSAKESDEGLSSIYGDESLGIDPSVDEQLKDYRLIAVFGIDNNGSNDINMIISFNNADGTAKTQSGWTASDIAGTSGDFCTGVWETTVVPTNGVDENTVTGSSMLTNREISVGLWKNAGALAYSTTGTTGENGTKGTASGTISYTSSYANATTDADATAGICYGNGSKNGVLSYVVKKTAQTWNAETAQKRQVKKVEKAS